MPPKGGPGAKKKAQLPGIVVSSNEALAAVDECSEPTLLGNQIDAGRNAEPHPSPGRWRPAVMGALLDGSPSAARQGVSCAEYKLLGPIANSATGCAEMVRESWVPAICFSAQRPAEIRLLHFRSSATRSSDERCRVAARPLYRNKGFTWTRGCHGDRRTFGCFRWISIEEGAADAHGPRGQGFCLMVEKSTGRLGSGFTLPAIIPRAKDGSIGAGLLCLLTVQCHRGPLHGWRAEIGMGPPGGAADMEDGGV